MGNGKDTNFTNFYQLGNDAEPNTEEERQKLIFPKTTNTDGQGAGNGKREFTN